ncbi:MAG: hypothetical protein QGG39_11305 [Candidatus Poribacteria bacterium]|nr:hypothetical protein [Candidatus Poribacteria bacterium]
MLETVVTDRALTGYCHAEGNDITQIAQVSKTFNRTSLGEIRFNLEDYEQAEHQKVTAFTP